MSKKVKCPHCGKKTVYSPENEFRPFCSERCQLIDFGKWSDEEFRVPDTENSVPQAEPNQEGSDDFHNFSDKVLH